MLKDLMLPASGTLASIEKLSSQLATHSVYRSVNSLAAARVYMEHQVWCVWDFMVLLKAVQNHVVPISHSWVPPRSGELAFVVYDLLSSEETDVDETGRTRSSHLETYLRSMTQAGADRTAIDRFLSDLRSGLDVASALKSSTAPPAAKTFVQRTLKIAGAQPHCFVAALCLSREGIIPDMFTSLLAHLPNDERLGLFRWYLKRHILLDGQRHGPGSALLFSQIVAADPVRLGQGLEAAKQALEGRLALLEAIRVALPQWHSAST